MSGALTTASPGRQLTVEPRHIIMISYFKEAKVAQDKVIALTATNERPATTFSGYAMLFVLLLAILADAYGIQQLGTYDGTGRGIVTVIAATLIFILVMPGFYMLQPNQAAAITLFGSYA